jgi:hypothetical protein
MRMMMDETWVLCPYNHQYEGIEWDMAIFGYI